MDHGICGEVIFLRDVVRSHTESSSNNPRRDLLAVVLISIDKFF